MDKYGDEGNNIDTSSNGNSSPGTASLGNPPNLNEGKGNGRRQLPNSRRRPSDQSQVEDTAGIPANRKVVAAKPKKGTFPTAVSRRQSSAGHPDTTPGQRASSAFRTGPPGNDGSRPAKASQSTNVVKGQGQEVSHITGKTSTSMQPRATDIGKGQPNRNVSATRTSVTELSSDMDKDMSDISPGPKLRSGLSKLAQGMVTGNRLSSTESINPVRSSVHKRPMPANDDDDEYVDTFRDGKPNNRRATTKKTPAKRSRDGNEDDGNEDDGNEDGDYEENRNEDDSNEDDSNEDDGESQADGDDDVLNDSEIFSDHGNDEDFPDDVGTMGEHRYA
ncbi:hypothetical protein B0T24DRAFT_718006 [Lasiosphaeria ovina]|uniref:Uncharacterized protein n=1 Tax=Lasiosphaeria ovina TaxID=92902 RepID=A0AAE0TUX8_9PEZI|nr:hypothetical protein B0T24DRAFT_718006 [Lasiosphaeria ovina]